MSLTEFNNREKATNTKNMFDIRELNELKQKYSILYTEYDTLKKKMNTDINNGLNRVSSNNPYLGKNIKFTDGKVCYVTNQGIAKPYTSQKIYDNTIGKNGCPTEVVSLNIPWLPSYIKGSTIATNPPLIVGSDVVEGESCGNEGYNVYVSKMVENIKSAYVGCYNALTSANSNVNIVPIMTSSNSVSGFQASASSIYSNNNNTFGPWCAFDQNPSTFWHSADNIYNSSTGEYIGSQGGGEYLSISFPNPLTVKQYAITPRPGFFVNRAPNTWIFYGVSNDGSLVKLDSQTNQTFASTSPKVYTISNTNTYTGYRLVVSKVGNNDQTTNRISLQIAGLNLYGETAANSVGAMTEVNGYTSYEQCQTYASENGYQYFGLQDGKCSVGNDLAKISMYGDASALRSSVPIWTSNTATGERNRCQLAGTGQLNVKSPSGKVIANVSPMFKGCDNWGTMKITSATYGGNCGVPIGNVTNKVAADLKCDYSGSCSIPISNATFGDPAQKCGKSFDVEYKCGGNKFTRNLAKSEGQTMILNCDEYIQTTCQFYLIVQNDGKVCIYQGKDPSVQTSVLVWSTPAYTGASKSPNPEWIASKGIFGRNYLKNGEGLASDEWVGSSDGSVRLYMQSDGNLVVYVSLTTSGCKAVNGVNYGNVGINSVYKMSEVGDSSLIGKMGYVNSNSELMEYPNDLLVYSDNYVSYPEKNMPSGTLNTLTTNNELDCQKSCSKVSNCAGYVYQGGSNTCWLKSNAKGEKVHNNTTNVGIRTPRPSVKSKTCSSNVVPIDSIMYSKYVKGSKMTSDTECNNPIVSTNLQIKYDKVLNELTMLGNDIADKMEQMYTNDNKIYEKMNMNSSQFSEDIKNYRNVKFGIFKYNQGNMVVSEGFSTMNDLNGMLSDSDLKVLQGNYRYILWSILAVGIVTVTVKAINK